MTHKTPGLCTAMISSFLITSCFFSFRLQCRKCFIWVDNMRREDRPGKGCIRGSQTLQGHCHIKVTSAPPPQHTFIYTSIYLICYWQAWQLQTLNKAHGLNCFPICILLTQSCCFLYISYGLKLLREGCTLSRKYICWYISL